MVETSGVELTFSSMMGGEDDMRIMSHEELQEYAEKYRNGEKVNYFDVSFFPSSKSWRPV